MAEPKVRIGGSGFTIATWRGSRLAYLQTIQDTPPQPVAGAQAVQPLDEPVPLEIVTAMAVGVGTLRCTFYELWNFPVWSMLPGLEGTNTLLDVLRRQISLGEVSMRKIIRAPSTTGIGLEIRARVYHNVVVTDVDEGEQINIGSMTLPKTLTMQYTHSTPV